MTGLIEDNRRHRDERVPINTTSSFYDLDGFRVGEEDLDRFQLDELGDVTGLDLAHLQCHIGLDTLSWARRGARVVGLDFSVPAVEEARALATEVGLADRARFVAADVDDAIDVLGGHGFDVVYAGNGALMCCPTSTAGLGPLPACCARADGSTSPSSTRRPTCSTTTTAPR